MFGNSKLGWPNLKQNNGLFSLHTYCHLERIIISFRYIHKNFKLIYTSNTILTIFSPKRSYSSLSSIQCNSTIITHQSEQSPRLLPSQLLELWCTSNFDLSSVFCPFITLKQAHTQTMCGPKFPSQSRFFSLSISPYTNDTTISSKHILNVTL